MIREMFFSRSFGAEMKSDIFSYATEEKAPSRQSDLIILCNVMNKHQELNCVEKFQLFRMLSVLFNRYFRDNNSKIRQKEMFRVAERIKD